jgi:hypothetical protein
LIAKAVLLRNLSYGKKLNAGEAAVIICEEVLAVIVEKSRFGKAVVRWLRPFAVFEWKSGVSVI